MSVEPVFEAIGPCVKPVAQVMKTTHSLKRLDERTKRIIETLLALFFIVVLSPLLITIALAVRATGPEVVFAHRRAGRGGKPFFCYKFRSMVPNAGAVLQAHLAADPDAALEWHSTHKLKNDPRVTRFGRMLRQSSVDELPQLFNILWGDMSFVGPRPITFDEFRFYGAVARDYLAVHPGLTGPWQVNGRSELSYAERVEYDRHYARNRSLALDLVILARTVPAVMRRTQTS